MFIDINVLFNVKFKFFRAYLSDEAKTSVHGFGDSDIQAKITIKRPSVNPKIMNSYKFEEKEIYMKISVWLSESFNHVIKL